MVKNMYIYQERLLPMIKMIFCFSLLLFTTNISLVGQEDADRKEKQNKDFMPLHLSIGVNTFPSEIILLAEYHTKSPWSFFIGSDFGNQRELDLINVRFDEENCFIRPLVDTLSRFGGYTDIAVGIGYNFSSSKRGLSAQLGVYNRFGGQDTFSEHDGAINMGFLGRIAYKSKLSKRLFFSIGMELNLVELVHLNCGISDFPVFDIDLIQVRFGYQIGGG